MTRLIGFLVVLLTSIATAAALAGAAAPATRPASPVPGVFDSPDIDSLYKQLPRLQGGCLELKLLPNVRLMPAPTTSFPPTGIEPYGQSFQFNGLTVYVEPIGATSRSVAGR